MTQSHDATPSAAAPAEAAAAPAPIDPRGPRFNQTCLALGIVLAFILGQWWIVPLLGVVLGLGAAFGAKAGLFFQVYAKLLKPRLGPPAELEDPRPPRFAAIVGTVFLAAATLAFVLGANLVGWVLAGIVAVLAALAATSGICVGCEIYTWAVRAGVFKVKAPLPS